MTNHKKRNNTKNGSQKGKTFSDGMTGNNVMSKEEMAKAISPTREKMSDG